MANTNPRKRRSAHRPHALRRPSPSPINETRANFETKRLLRINRTYDSRLAKGTRFDWHHYNRSSFSRMSNVQQKRILVVAEMVHDKGRVAAHSCTECVAQGLPDGCWIWQYDQIERMGQANNQCAYCYWRGKKCDVYAYTINTSLSYSASPNDSSRRVSMPKVPAHEVVVPKRTSMNIQPHATESDVISISSDSDEHSNEEGVEFAVKSHTGNARRGAAEAPSIYDYKSLFPLERDNAPGELNPAQNFMLGICEEAARPVNTQEELKSSPPWLKGSSVPKLAPSDVYATRLTELQSLLQYAIKRGNEDKFDETERIRAVEQASGILQKALGVEDDWRQGLPVLKTG